MATVTLAIALPDLEAHALAVIMASLGPEQFEHAFQHWLNQWNASDIYSPQVEAKDSRNNNCFTFVDLAG